MIMKDNGLECDGCSQDEAIKVVNAFIKDEQNFNYARGKTAACARERGASAAHRLLDRLLGPTAELGCVHSDERKYS